MKQKIAIVGAGISGSLMAYELQKKGNEVFVFASKKKPAASQVAGGLFNPITGKHFTKTWLHDLLYPKLFEYYPLLEKELNSKFFNPCGIIRILKNESQKEQFLNRIKIQNLETQTEYIPNLKWYKKNNNGGIKINNSGWVDVPKMLDAISQKLENKIEENIFNYYDLKVAEDSVEYKFKRYDKIIFCEGYYGTENPFFKDLPFKPVKGESMLATVPNYSTLEIINFGHWIINLSENRIRIGATYDWDAIDSVPSENAKELFIKNLESQEIKNSSNYIMEAGIRPSTIDRRPFLGSHPKYKPLFIVNGLGTKGVSLAPYFIEKMVDFIEFGKELEVELNIKRINALY